MADSAFTLNGGGLSFNPGGVRSSAGATSIPSGNVFTPNIDLPKVPYAPSVNAEQNARTIEALTLARQHGYDYSTLRANNQAISDSIDPQSGEFNDKEYQKRASIDPQVAQHYAATIGAVNEARQKQIDTAKAKLEQGIQRQSALAGMFESLLVKQDEHGNPVPPTSDDIFKMGPQVMRVLGLDYNNPKDLSFLAQNTIELTGSGNPAEIRTNIEKKAASVLQTLDRMKYIHGQLSLVNTGGTQIPVMENARTGTMTPAGGVALTNTPSPAERNQIVDVKTPLGQTIQVPRQGAGPMYTGTGQVAAGSGGGGPAIGASPDTLTGSYLEKRGGDVADYEKELDASAGTSARSIIQFDRLKDLMDEGVKTGGGAAFRETAARTLQGILENTYGYYARQSGDPAKIQEAEDKIKAAVETVNQGKLGNAQEFNKFAIQTAMGILSTQLRGQLGSKINQMEFATYLNANPNMVLDPQANRQILDYMKKLAGLNIAEQDEFNAWKKAGKPVTEFPNYWNKKLRDEKLLDMPATLAGIKKDYEARMAKDANGSGTSKQSAAGASRQPSQANLDYLKAHPETADKFNKNFGAGAAEKILGK